MSKSPTVRAILDSFVNKLEEACRREVHERLLNALQPHMAYVGKRPPVLKHKTRSHPKGEKRSASELEELTAHLHVMIERNPGANVRELGGLLECTTRELVLPIAKLLASKAIAKKGARSATRYFPK